MKVEILITTVLAIPLVWAARNSCIHHINATAGYIASPNYPDLYPNSQNCFWKLEANPGERIRLTFHDFYLEESGDCSADYVKLYDGSTIDDPLLGKFCNNGITPPDAISTASTLLVEFHMDSSVQYKGFFASYVGESCIICSKGLKDTKRNLTQLLLDTRQQAHIIHKWDSNVTRIAVTLFLNNRQFFAPKNKYGGEITYELSLQLLSKLFLKEKISTKDLTLYINALTVTCIDPKNFFGVNLVKELRMRANKSNNTHPFSILTLCNARDAMTMGDVQKLHEQYYAHFRPVWTDAQAMAVMALSCIYSRSELNLNESILSNMTSELKSQQHKNGTIDNWKTTALVLQALIAAGEYGTDFNFTAAVKFLLGDIVNHSNINDIYYVLPILNGMSLANISSDHCTTFIQSEGRSSLRELPVERIQVQISVIAGDDMDFSRTWKVKVPLNSSFYHVLENVGTMEPAYKVRYGVSEGKPHIVGLGNFSDDAENGIFWFIYSKPLSSPGNLQLIELSPVDISVTGSEEMILWYRSGFWTNSGEGSGELI